MSRSIKDQLDELKYEIQATRKFGRTDPSPYLAHADLSFALRRRNPQAPTPKVTSFSDWVFGLYHPTHDPRALQLGRAGEAYVEQIRKVKKRLAARPPDSGWELEFADRDDNSEPYIITSLQLNGKALRAKPDRVLRQISTGIRRIVEIKTTRTLRPIPAFGWPNLKVQLWCYGSIDTWLNAPKVLLTGEILNLSDGRRYRTSTWDSRDLRIHAECEELFLLFGGQCAKLA